MRNACFPIIKPNIHNSPSSCTRWISSLNHKVPYDSMEYGAVVIPGLGQCGYVVARLGSMAIIELHYERSLFVDVREIQTMDRKI